MLEHGIANSILHLLISAISGSSIARGVSFLRNNLGQQIFPKALMIIDDPFIKGGWVPMPFDGEGVKCTRQNIIENGILNNWLLNSSAAMQLGIETNGHARLNIGGPPSIGVSNFYIPPSQTSLSNND